MSIFKRKSLSAAVVAGLSAIQRASVSVDGSEDAPPFDNCKYRRCDLPGQCREEGKCHHPKESP